MSRKFWRYKKLYYCPDCRKEFEFVKISFQYSEKGSEKLHLCPFCDSTNFKERKGVYCRYCGMRIGAHERYCSNACRRAGEKLFKKNEFNDLFKNPDWDSLKNAKNIITNIEPFKESTETLITKILMGIFGCVPAFDRFFKEGYKIFHGGENISFNETGFEKLQKR